MNATRTGIGDALRKARLQQGKSLEEASRDTRIRTEYIDALECERFERLRGDVYVRGFLRSYSSYLGLSPDKVVSAYARMTGLPEPAPEPVEPSKPAGNVGLHLLHRRPNWKLAVGAAVGLLVIFGVAGLLSKGSPAPRTGPLAPQGGVITQPPVTVVLVASKPVDATIIADGKQVFAGTLKKGKTMTFSAASLLRLELAKGGLVDLVVDGKHIGAPGRPTSPWSASFQPQDYRATPSASPAG